MTHDAAGSPPTPDTVDQLRARLAQLEADNVTLRAANAELAARYEQLNVILDAVPVMLAYGSADFRLTHVNRAMAQWWGRDKDEVAGKPLNEVMLPGGFEAARPFILQAGADRRTVTHDHTIMGRDGQLHVLRQSYAPHYDETGALQGYAGVVLDITEERRTDEILRENARQAAVIKERGRLARELHDAATQTIYSAMLIAEALPQVWARSPEEGERNLAKLRELVRGALAEMRTLLFELRPWTLESVEFARLLEYLKDAMAGRARVRVMWDVADDCPMTPEQKTTLYRIAQEAFNNIVKHARAAHVWVTLRREGERGILTIRDDGRGFEPAEVAGDRMGLQIMRERIAAIGGALTVASAPGRGVTVEAGWTVEE